MLAAWICWLLCKALVIMDSIFEIYRLPSISNSISNSMNHLWCQTESFVVNFRLRAPKLSLSLWIVKKGLQVLNTTVRCSYQVSFFFTYFSMTSNLFFRNKSMMAKKEASRWWLIGCVVDSALPAKLLYSEKIKERLMFEPQLRYSLVFHWASFWVLSIIPRVISTGYW